MHFLVDFLNDVTQEQINQYFLDNNCTLIKQFNHFNNVYHVECNIEPPKTSIVEYVVNDTESTMSLLNYQQTLIPTQELIQIDVQNDNNWWKVASLWDVDFSNPTIDQELYGKNVTVYIMDSGIDASHPEFQGRNVQLFHSFDGTYDDLSGHGTAIASLISGKTCGLTNAELKIVKILNEGQITSLSQLLTAFDAIIADLPNTKFAVVNMSWCVPRNEYLDAKIASMVRQNFLMVAAAGNNGGPIEDVTPAALPEVITIGAYNENFEPCDFSAYTGSSTGVTQNTVNHGALDGWAPGQNLYAAVPGGGYGIVAGTSYSAAIHSGALAYLVDLDFASAEGDIDPCMTNGMISIADAGALSRQNILNLTGNYTASVNKISTYACQTSHNASVVYFPERLAIFSGEMQCRTIVSRKDVSKVTFDKPLPGTMQMSNSGTLYGQVDLGPNDPDYKIESYIVTMHLRNGEIQQKPLQISYRKQEMDFSNIPVDQSWVIQVLGITCGNFSTCNKQCPAGGFSPSVLCCQPKAELVCEQCTPVAFCM